MSSKTGGFFGRNLKKLISWGWGWRGVYLFSSHKRLRVAVERVLVLIFGTVCRSVRLVMFNKEANSLNIIIILNSKLINYWNRIGILNELYHFVIIFHLENFERFFGSKHAKKSFMPTIAIKDMPKFFMKKFKNFFGVTGA